jgi:hypothetical protein
MLTMLPVWIQLTTFGSLFNVIQADKSNEEIRGKCQWLALSTIRILCLSYLPNLWHFTKLYQEHIWGRKLGGNIITIVYNLSNNLLEIWHIWQKHVRHALQTDVLPWNLAPYSWNENRAFLLQFLLSPFHFYCTCFEDQYCFLGWIAVPA